MSPHGRLPGALCHPIQLVRVSPVPTPCCGLVPKLPLLRGPCAVMADRPI
jgi:hypothetical protein